jgi:amino-acid N-acetyltransferase
MTIQPAAPDDFDAVRDLLRAVGLPHEDLTPAHLNHFLVARDGKRLCGAAGIEPCGDAALLRSLAVKPGCRHDGLGGCLVDAVEERTRQQGICALYLLTTTAAGYFENHGYERADRDTLPEPVRQTEEAARLCPSSATCMRRELVAANDGRPAPRS